MVIQKSQRWKLKSGAIVHIRLVGDGIVIYEDPEDKEASVWNLVEDFLNHCQFVDIDL